MAFIKCPSCGALISDRAANCPKCGVFMENHLPPSEHAINHYSVPIKIVDKAKECQTVEDKKENKVSETFKIEQKPYEEALDNIDVPQDEAQQNDASPVEKPSEEEQQSEAIPVKETPVAEDQQRDSAPVVVPSQIEPKNKKTGLIVGEIVGALVLVGSGLFFLLRDNKVATKQESIIAETTVPSKDSKQMGDSNIPDWLYENEWDDMDPMGYDVESAIVFNFKPDNTFIFKECTWEYDEDMGYSEIEYHGTYSIDGDIISIVFSDGRSRSMTIDYDYQTLGYNGKVLRSSASSFSIDYISRGEVFFPEYSDKAEKFCRVITDSDNNNVGLDIRFYPGLGVSEYFSGSVDIDAPQKRIKLFHNGKNELYDSDGVLRAKVVVDCFGDFELVGDGQQWYLGHYMTEH